MSEFDPTKPALVYDELNREFFPWEPKWAEPFRKDALLDFDPGNGVVEWDGMLLAGWRPITNTAQD